jgi:uncharacterized protein (DUF58 family)
MAIEWRCRAAVQSLYDASHNHDELGFTLIRGKISTCV